MQIGAHNTIFTFISYLKLIILLETSITQVFASIRSISNQSREYLKDHYTHKNTHAQI